MLTFEESYVGTCIQCRLTPLANNACIHLVLPTVCTYTLKLICRVFVCLGSAVTILLGY